jgi:hypothetical protein
MNRYESERECRSVSVGVRHCDFVNWGWRWVI